MPQKKSTKRNPINQNKKQEQNQRNKQHKNHNQFLFPRTVRVIQNILDTQKIYNNQNRKIRKRIKTNLIDDPPNRSGLQIISDKMNHRIKVILKIDQTLIKPGHPKHLQLKKYKNNH